MYVMFGDNFGMNNYKKKHMPVYWREIEHAYTVYALYV